MSVRMRCDRHHVAARCSVGIICVGAATAAARCAQRRSPHGLVRVEAHALSPRRRRRRHCVVAMSWTQLCCCLRHCNRVVARARTASLGAEPTPVASEIVRGCHARHHCAIGACAAAIHDHAIPARLFRFSLLNPVRPCFRPSVRSCVKTDVFPFVALRASTRGVTKKTQAHTCTYARTRGLHCGGSESTERRRPRVRVETASRVCVRALSLFGLLWREGAGFLHFFHRFSAWK